MTWTIIISIAVLYLIANVVIYIWQERFLFKPEKLPEDFKFKYA